MVEPRRERLGADERRVPDDGVDPRGPRRAVRVTVEERAVVQRESIGGGDAGRGREPEAGQLERDPVDVDAVQRPQQARRVGRPGGEPLGGGPEERPGADGRVEHRGHAFGDRADRPVHQRGGDGLGGEVLPAGVAVVGVERGLVARADRPVLDSPERVPGGGRNPDVVERRRERRQGPAGGPAEPRGEPGAARQQARQPGRLAGVVERRAERVDEALTGRDGGLGGRHGHGGVGRRAT
ncbi:MAG: hypothetical protein U5J98_00750 [Halobacteriales archaeon]|nr:hypothetical protein [Halobacteriales archaeon]